jgi:DNA-binding XRE family transcriptional regulator
MVDKKVKHTGFSRYGDPMTMRRQEPLPLEDGQTMGERIRALREEAQMTQDEVAAIVGVSKAAVSQWETGSAQNIRLQTFLKLLNLFNVEFEYLIFGDTRRLRRP